MSKSTKGIPNDEIRDRILVAQSADVFDALDSLGYSNQCLDVGIKPIRDDMKIAGPAFTIVGARDPLYGDDVEGDEFSNFALFDKLYEGCIIVINAERDDVCGHWGEMTSYGAKNAGAAGVVVDGGTRDKTGILKIPGWHCFARYTTPIESRKRWRVRQIQGTIHMTGTLTKAVRVDPGDWIFADNDGVLVIPADVIPDLLPVVEDISHREDLAREAFARGWQIKKVVEAFDRA